MLPRFNGWLRDNAHLPGWISVPVALVALVGAVVVGLLAIGGPLREFATFPVPLWGAAVALAAVALGARYGARRGSRPRPVEEKPAADDAELVQFVNAWMMPAWQKATEVLIPIRGDVKSKHGERIEALLQMAVIDSAIATWRAVQERIKGERGGDLDGLVAAMYEKYELIVRWIDEAGDMVDQPWSDNRRFREWQAEDGKLLDHLRDFVARPAASSSALAVVYRRTEEGGVSKIVRERLAKRPSSGRPDGVG